MPSERIDSLRYPNIFYFLLSSAFMVGFSLWIIAFYLGISEISYVSKISYSLRLFIVLFLLYYAVSITISDSDRIKNLIILIFIPILYLFLFLLSIFNLGFDFEIKTIIGQFVLNGLPALIVGFMCARYDLGVSLLLFIEKFSIIIFPAIIIYIFRIFFLNEELGFVELHKLGQIDYLYLGYSLLSLFLASSLLFLIKGSGIFNYRLVLILGYCMGIIVSQARGAALGAFVLLAFMFFTNIYNRKKVLLLTLLSLLLFLVYGLLLDSFPSRYRLTDESLKINSNSKNIDFEAIYETGSFQFFSDYSHLGVEIDPVTRTCSINSKEVSDHLSTDEKFYKKLLDSDCEIKLSRPSLFIISINEIAKNPLTGMGPLSFKLKYFGYHPHNIILELLVELGVIFGGGIVALLTYVFFVFFVRIKNLNSSSQIAFFFGIAFMPMFLLSGTVWSNSIFLFLAGYSVMFLCDRKL